MDRRRVNREIGNVLISSGVKRNVSIELRSRSEGASHDVHFSPTHAGAGVRRHGGLQPPGPRLALALEPAQRVLSRAVYADEYAASIRECFEETPPQQAAVLASHEAHVAAQMANAAVARLVGSARAVGAP